MEFLVQGQKVLIDPEDEAIFHSYKWHINDSGYAVWRGEINGEKKTIRLHRLITRAPTGLIVDHINRNKLNNRKRNLRCTTQSVNMQNTDRVENAKGYYYSNSECRKNNKWVVDFRGINNTFATEEEAKQAVEDIKNGTFVKHKDLIHEKCLKCGDYKQFYGGAWVCRACSLRRMKEYYKRKKNKEKNNE